MRHASFRGMFSWAAAAWTTHPSRNDVLGMLLFTSFFRRYSATSPENEAGSLKKKCHLNEIINFRPLLAHRDNGQLDRADHRPYWIGRSYPSTYAPTTNRYLRISPNICQYLPISANICQSNTSDLLISANPTYPIYKYLPIQYPRSAIICQSSLADLQTSAHLICQICQSKHELGDRREEKSSQQDGLHGTSS